MILKKVYLTVCYILIYYSSFCQFEPLIRNILLADSFNRDYSREKIFIHYDKRYYNVNDTLWLKGYIVSAKDCAASDSSKIAYIEIINSSGGLIKRTSTYCAAGIFYSNIGLNETDFKQGTYLLKAYTNHMRNYGDSLFFESKFQVINPSGNEWDLSVRNISLSNKRFVLSAVLQPLSGESVSQQNVSVVLRSKNRIIFKQNTVTDRIGYISIDTSLKKEDIKNTVQLEISNNDYLKVQLPVQVNEEQQIDLQFLPEGGTFIANKLQQLGFKAVDIFGKGIKVKGRIENSRKQLVTKFSAVHNGMGIVWIKSEMDESYTAVLDNGITVKLPLPQRSGTQLQIVNHPGSDSVAVIIDASPDLYDHQYFFRATARGISCAMGTIRIENKPFKLSISKRAFPSGICRFTLYDDDFLPVNERVILIWHHDTLKLNLTAQKPIYDNRDSVHILLRAKKINAEPTIGSFSVAVIDTAQLPYAKHAENIISYLLLCSEIRGKIEDPSYYFDNPLPEATEALALTQGWVRYNQFFSKPLLEYETEFTINGKVLNIFNKPVAKTSITLFGKDGMANPFFLSTETNKNGNFVFKDFPTFMTDSIGMLIRALNKNGKSFGIGVDIDAPTFPDTYSFNQPLNQNNILYDTTISRYLREQAKIYTRFKKEKGYLPEVVVTSRITIRGSKNLNTDGGADQIITKKVLEKMPKENLLDVLSQKVPGFHKGTLSKSHLQVYRRNGDLIIFIIDGYNINQAYDPVSESFTAFADYIETYLKYITAEEVVGIEIMNTSKNTFAYEKYYKISNSGLMSYTFIEITTHSGNGAFNKKIPGMYLYKPLVPVISKMFYSPRYNVDETDSPISDYRSTLYWKPDIITNEKGEAEFSFYTSDSNGGYLVIVQGTDLNGGLGTVYLPLFIKKEDKRAIK